ncbi:MAG TPA: hypothetical protein VJ951_05890 [Bacteroidales bacterium]|nr:hypothetical protein [Bacteroidales bacterium]
MKETLLIFMISILGLMLLNNCSSEKKKTASVAKEMAEEIPENSASEDLGVNTEVSTAGLPNNLRQCTAYFETFRHPFTGEELNREVLGLHTDGLCEYKEEMPNNGLMHCKYSEQTRAVMAQYYEDVVLSGPGSMGFKTKLYTIDGKRVTNPLDEVLNNGTCTISGY